MSDILNSAVSELKANLSSFHSFRLKFLRRDNISISTNGRISKGQSLKDSVTYIDHVKNNK